ncbi:MAG: hypothetical protein DYG98_00895 [Haliscomenobacteraceae bacterium CHB4]|nr:hypothetical protein [Haliscomenobacteraceae bacterium CHB4]
MESTPRFINLTNLYHLSSTFSQIYFQTQKWGLWLKKWQVDLNFEDFLAARSMGARHFFRRGVANILNGYPLLF